MQDLPSKESKQGTNKGTNRLKLAGAIALSGSNRLGFNTPPPVEVHRDPKNRAKKAAGAFVFAAALGAGVGGLLGLKDAKGDGPRLKTAVKILTVARKSYDAGKTSVDKEYLSPLRGNEDKCGKAILMLHDDKRLSITVNPRLANGLIRNEDCQGDVRVLRHELDDIVNVEHDVVAYDANAIATQTGAVALDRADAANDDEILNGTEVGAALGALVGGISGIGMVALGRRQ